MVTENGMAMIKADELSDLLEQIENLKKGNEYLRKGLLMATHQTKSSNGDVKVTRKDFVKMYLDAVNAMFENDHSEDNDVYGYDMEIHWHGVYCSCGDGAEVCNNLIPGIEGCDDDLDEDDCQ